MSATAARPDPVRAIATGALIVGTLDILDAVIFFGIRNGVAPGRILQGIASGLLGRASFDGGVKTMALGLVCHYTIATLIVLTYWLVSRKLAFLRCDFWIWGPLYGIVAWCVMNFVVIPLSAATQGAFVTIVVINGILIHMFGIGLPSAWVARDRDRKRLVARADAE